MGRRAQRSQKKKKKIVDGKKKVILEIKMEIQRKGFPCQMLRWKLTKG